jgi:hypothetical protein
MLPTDTFYTMAVFVTQEDSLNTHCIGGMSPISHSVLVSLFLIRHFQVTHAFPSPYNISYELFKDISLLYYSCSGQQKEKQSGDHFQ